MDELIRKSAIGVTIAAFSAASIARPHDELLPDTADYSKLVSTTLATGGSTDTGGAIYVTNAISGEVYPVDAPLPPLSTFIIKAD